MLGRNNRVHLGVVARPDDASHWFFQAWFRDSGGGGADFDLTDAIQVTFGS